MSKVKAKDVGGLVKKRRLSSLELNISKNLMMADYIRLLSVYSPVTTTLQTEDEPVIVNYITNTLNLTNDYEKLKVVAFSHRFTDKKDWLLFFKNQTTCDYARTITPPRYGKGNEMSRQLEVINLQAALKSLSSVTGLSTYAITFNLTEEQIEEAEESGNAMKWLTVKLRYQFKKVLNRYPDYYLVTEYSDEGRLHFHGTILLNPADVEKVRLCFKQVNPARRSITLVQQPDILNYWPIRWGSYITKTESQLNQKAPHQLYVGGNLRVEAEYHYTTLRELFIQCKNGTAVEPLTPAQQLREHFTEGFSQ